MTRSIGEEPVQRPEWTEKQLRMRDSVMRAKAMTQVVRHNILDIGLSACVLLLPPIAALAAVFAMHPLQNIDPPQGEQASRRVPYDFSTTAYPEQSNGNDLSRAVLPPDGAEELDSERGHASGATLQLIVEGESFHAPRAMATVGLASPDAASGKSGVEAIVSIRRFDRPQAIGSASDEPLHISAYADETGTKLWRNRLRPLRPIVTEAAPVPNEPLPTRAVLAAFFGALVLSSIVAGLIFRFDRKVRA
jgi:hypothetical protein